MRAGTAELNITPEVGGVIPGQWLPRTAKSVHDPLLVNALVLECEDERVAIVSADVVSLKARVVAAARGLIADMTGIRPDGALLAATHTHTGPPVADALGTEADEAVVEALPRAIATTIARANEQLRPALVATWSGSAPGLAFPRRYHMRDGTVQMHPPKGSPEVLGPEDQADPTIAGFHIWAESGELLAACINFACHPIVVGGACFYSADYPGGVREALRRLHGPTATVVYLNGPCGDVGPDNVDDTARSRYGEEWVSRIGFGLAGFATGLSSVAQPRESLRLAVVSRQVRIGLRPVPDDLVRKAEATLSKEEIRTPPQDQERIRLREYLLLDRERREQDYVDAEITVMKVGDAAIVGLPGEVFADIGRRIRGASPFPHTIIAELANGCHGYVPTRKAFEGGGYETWLARSSKLVPEAGDRMVAAATALLCQLEPGGEGG